MATRGIRAPARTKYSNYLARVNVTRTKFNHISSRTSRDRFKVLALDLGTIFAGLFEKNLNSPLALSLSSHCHENENTCVITCWPPRCSERRIEFQGQQFRLHCILLITMVKLFQRAIGRSSIGLLKNGKQSFFICVLTATLWLSMLRDVFIYISNNVNS